MEAIVILGAVAYFIYRYRRDYNKLQAKWKAGRKSGAAPSVVQGASPYDEHSAYVVLEEPAAKTPYFTGHFASREAVLGSDPTQLGNYAEITTNPLKVEDIASDVLSMDGSSFDPGWSNPDWNSQD